MYAYDTHPIGWADAIGPFPERHQDALVLSLRRTISHRTRGTQVTCPHTMSKEGQVQGMEAKSDRRIVWRAPVSGKLGVDEGLDIFDIGGQTDVNLCKTV
jgi:hypothetical protein